MSYIYICKYSMLHINMFLYYLLYKVGYFTKHNFHDVHLRLLWRPSSRSIYACSSSFYRPVWFCVKTMKLRHTMSPAPPPKKNNAISKHRELILDFNPPEEYAPHITQIWLETKMKTTNQTISCFLWVQSFVLAGGIFKSYWGAGADWGLRNSEDTKLIHNPPNTGSYTKMHSECTPRCYCNLLLLRLCVGGRSTQEYKGNAFGPRTTPNALRGATSLLLLRLCVGGRSTQVYIQSNGK